MTLSRERGAPPVRLGSTARIGTGRRDDRAEDVGGTVPRVLRVAAALGWRLLVVVAALSVIGVVASYLAAVVVPVAVALLLAALLSPAVHRLHGSGVPRGVATALVMVGGLALLGGLLTFVVVTFVRGVPALAAELSTSVDTVSGWLNAGPIIGAVIGGGAALLIALVADGPVTALIVLVIIVAVMQPLLLGRAVALHPLAVVLSIAAGVVVAGIAGALFAVPLLAVLNSGIRSLLSPADQHVDPDDVHTSSPEETGPDEPGLDREPALVEADPRVG